MVQPGQQSWAGPEAPGASRSFLKLSELQMVNSMEVYMIDDDMWKNVFTGHDFSCIELKKFCLVLSGITFIGRASTSLSK